MSDNLEKAVKIAKELERRKVTNIMADYKPYDYQKKFHNTLASQRLLMAGNRVGKSFCGAKIYWRNCEKSRCTKCD
jgi:hypothetical protein